MRPANEVDPAFFNIPALKRHNSRLLFTMAVKADNRRKVEKKIETEELRRQDKRREEKRREEKRRAAQ